MGGSLHDLRLIRGSGFLDKLELGEQTLADKGCIDGALAHKIVTPTKKRPHQDEMDMPHEERKRNWCIQQVRALVEHVIGRVKRFSILSKHYRNRKLDVHGDHFRTSCALTNLDMRCNPMRTRPHRLIRREN